MDEAKFSTILQALLNPDNEIRKAAEAEFEATKLSNGTWVMHALSHILATDAPEDIHFISLPLLRKMFAKSDLTFNTLAPSEQEVIKNNVVAAFTRLTSTKMNSSISATLAALAAKVYYLKHTWDDLWGNLVQTIGNASADVRLRQGSCMVLGSCASVLEPYLRSQHGNIVNGLISCLSNPDAALRVAASESLVALIDTVPESAISQYRAIPSHLIDGVELSLNAGDESSCITELCSLCTLIETSPSLINVESSVKMLNACMQIAANVAVPSPVRHVAVEVLVVACEHTKVMKSRKGQPSMAISLIDLLFNYVLNPPVADDWDVTEESECAEVEGDSDFDIGVTGLDRVCTAVGPKVAAPHAQQLVQSNIHSPSWNHRQAALALLTYTTEGLKSAFLSHLDFTINLCVTATRDENKVVRYTAHQCLSQMNSDFSPDLELKHHALYMPALIAGLSDPVPRVAGMAAAAINSFFDEAENDDDMHAANILQPYIAQVCPPLLALFNNSPHLFIRSTVLSALSSVISTEKSHMIPYVNDLLPIFQGVLAIPDDPSNLQAIRMHKCRAIECTTLLAGSVKYEHFKQYADSVCQYLATLMAENLTTDDPRLAYVLRGWTNMVDCMQEHVLPYMPTVMPSLIALAKLDCDFVIEEANVGDEEDNHEEEEGTERMLINIPGKGEIVMKTKTSLIEDKTTAANILCEFVRILKGQFAPWVNETIDVAKNLLAFCANSDVRILGCEIYENLLDVCSKVAPQQLPEFAIDVIAEIKKAILAERDFDLIGNYLDLLEKVAKVCGSNIDTNAVLIFTQLVRETCVKSGERRGKAKKEMEAMQACGEDEEEDLDVAQGKVDTEEEILKNCQSAVESFLEHVPTFTPLFEEHIYPIAGQMIGSSDQSIQSVGVAFVASYIEFSTGKSALNRLGDVIPPLLNFSSQLNLNFDLLHNTFNAIRITVKVLAESFPQPHTPSIDFAISASTNIIKFLTAPKVLQNEDYIGASTNAASAAINIIQYFGAHIPSTTQLFQAVVARLPFPDDDEIEACRVHSTLVEMILSGHSLAAGQYRASIVGKLRDASPDCLDKKTVDALAKL